jgi:hypothetical protein
MAPNRAEWTVGLDIISGFSRVLVGSIRRAPLFRLDLVYVDSASTQSMFSVV